MNKRVEHGVQDLCGSHLLNTDGSPGVDCTGVGDDSEGGRLAAGIVEPVVLGEQVWLVTQFQNFIFIQCLEGTLSYHFLYLGFQVTQVSLFLCLEYHLLCLFSCFFYV